MGRRPRIDLAGFHHVVNRGIERNNVYKSNIALETIKSVNS